MQFIYTKQVNSDIISVFHMRDAEENKIEKYLKQKYPDIIFERDKSFNYVVDGVTRDFKIIIDYDTYLIKVISNSEDTNKKVFEK